MKAALLKAYGDVDRFEIQEVPLPEPGPNELLLKIEASAVNPFDLIVRQGYMAQYIPLDLPAILGGDAAGVVAKLGAGVVNFAVGDRVIADFTTNGKGAHAEYGVVPISAVAKLPDNLSFEQGAALPKAGLTGRQTVIALDVKAGSRVLVSGGLGMVGRSAIQYLYELGARPVAAVRGARLEEARQLAGDAVDIDKVPDAATFDHAINTVAAAFPTVLAHVRDGGHVVNIVQVPDGANPGGRVRVTQVYHHPDAETLAAVAKAAGRGELNIPIAKTLQLRDIGAAQEAVAAGIPGKVILKH